MNSVFAGPANRLYYLYQWTVLQGYKGWRSIVRRKIRGPRGKVRLYDVVTQDHPSVLVFIWDTQVRAYRDANGLYGL